MTTIDTLFLFGTPGQLVVLDILYTWNIVGAKHYLHQHYQVQ